MVKQLLFAVAFIFLATDISATTWKHFHFHRNKPLLENSAFPDMWFIQKLDHFDRTNQTTWKQRYFKNDQLYKTGGPVLLNIGGEGPMSTVWMTNGLWYDIAQQHNAVMFSLEHRFYGSSHPTKDCSVENLRFLSSSQALSDLANFVNWIKLSYPNSKVYSFGGSYSGALSAWLRQRYPFLIDGAFSASGPYNAKVDFFEYENTVEFVTDTAVPGCFDTVMTAINIIQSMFQTEKTKLKEQLHLCQTPTDDYNDLNTIIDTILDPFDEAVQYGDDNREWEGETPVFKDAKAVCLQLLPGGKPSVNPLQSVSKLVNFYLNATKQKCLDTAYKSNVEMLSTIDWISSGVSGGARQWVWQTCTEFGYYQTIHGTLNMTDPLPLSYFLQQCSDVYGKQFGQPDFLQKMANMSNIAYGALDLQASNLIIFNGNYDPWSRLSITYPLVPSHETYSFFVPEAAHCAVMYPAQESDTLALKAARQSIMEIFDQWITGHVQDDFKGPKLSHA